MAGDGRQATGAVGAVIVHAIEAVPSAAPTIRLLITDLDNTLYDWVGWYAAALQAMVGRAAEIVGCTRDRLLDELRDAYTAHGSVEEPRALLELPVVRQQFADRHVAGRALEPALAAFVRPEPGSLRAYPGVPEALAHLSALGIPIVGHTEASPANAVRRLRRLDLHDHFAALFAGASHRPGGDDREPALPGAVSPAPNFLVRQLGPELAKPDPRTVLEICSHIGVSPSQVLYVGDNLDRDIAMARRAGAWAAWARFGTKHDPRDWSRLVRITHWTEAQVRRAERALPTGDDPPHATLAASFAEIFEHFEFQTAAETDAESA